MDRFFDLEEDPHFWDVLDELEGDPLIIAALISTLVRWALEDPYRAPKRRADIRVLKSAPVMYGDRTYALRLAYTVVEYVKPRDGKSGVVKALHVWPWEEQEPLDFTIPETARDHSH